MDTKNKMHSKQRGLKWFGKIARIDPSNPARSALHYALGEFRRPRGKPPKTCLCIMKQQLKSELNMNWNEAFDVVKDEKDCKILRLSYVANIVVLS